jgi:S1-C subfamily serine protease
LPGKWAGGIVAGALVDTWGSSVVASMIKFTCSRKREYGVRQGVRALLVSCLTFGCGPSYPPSEYPPAPPPKTDAAGRALVPAPAGSLWRHDVNAAVDRGLGHFLQRVDVEPAFADDKFQGFKILQLHPQAWWQGVDILPGDIVLSLNGMPIERATEAYAAFESLRTANELRVAYLRNGQRRELKYAIVEQTASGAAAAPAAVAPPSDVTAADKPK